MSFFEIWLQGLVIITGLMTILWLISIAVRNASIADIFWGIGFVIINAFYFIRMEGIETRKLIMLSLVTIWGIRLSAYIAWRNAGKGEDFRYRQFRKKYGEKRYWWVSFFQVFLLQGVLMWIISATLLGAHSGVMGNGTGILDLAGMAVWITGFLFETVGDFQMASFRANPENKGKVLDTGLWRFTRHPNYFGDSAVWWGYGLLCLGAGSYLPVAGSLIMTILIIRVSGVALLEKDLVVKKPGYEDYMKKTSSFFPWFPAVKGGIPGNGQGTVKEI